MNFPDLPHLKQLQKDLWQWPKSRAAVMVGAGLSLNAEPRPGTHTRFPTWRELVGAMFDELHPVGPDASPLHDKDRDRASANPLRIASEYEAAFDRPKLNALIRAQNPDSDYQPGKLHNLLMQLPWVDVFTTNYDTLLERTEVPGRTYQLVTKANELTTAFAPRIVKLHGSFPSQTPFIITEEDFRTYPRDFAPFVNTVQQSLLENTFVLIGFSGDDPNFLEWTGWIRDQLDRNHAPVYLVGAYDWGTPERSLLARRGVTLIDLAPLFKDVPTPNGVHPTSIEWFLNSLVAARPIRQEKWPHLTQGTQPSSHTGPMIIDGRAPIPPAVDWFPRSLGVPGGKKDLDFEEVVKVVRRWRFERNNYPGWIIPPQQKRSEIWESTRRWVEPLISAVKAWPPEDRLIVFREVNWRLEIAMAPLFTEVVGPFHDALKGVYERLARGELLSGSASLPGVIQIQGVEFADAWIEIAVGLLRDARESYDEAGWLSLKAQIDGVVQHYKRHSDRIRYEEALHAMWNVDRTSAKAIVSRWEPSASSPLAMMWKAGLLAELEEPAEGRSLLRSALQEIRRSLRNQGQNIELLSWEGWCTYSLGCIESDLDLSSLGSFREEFGELWQDLKAWDCDPWSFKESFDLTLSGEPPRPQKLKTEIHGFDPGHVSVSHSMGNDLLGPVLPAFAYIRFFERAGVPMRLSSISTTGDTLGKACSWIAPLLSFWGPAVLVRAGKSKDLIDAEFLSRTRVAEMTPLLAKQIYVWCFGILERELQLLASTLEPSVTQTSLLKALIEVLSRLAFKVDDKDLERTFPLVLHLHNQLGRRFYPSLHDCCVPWFLRLFEAADDSRLLEWLPLLIKAPLSIEGFQSPMPLFQAWPDPMQSFPNMRLVGQENSAAKELIVNVRDATDWLLKRAASESGEARRRAIHRLTYVYHTKLMPPEQQARLGELLWSQTNAGNLPDIRHLAVFGYFYLPSPPDTDVIARVKAYLLSLPSKGSVTRNEKGSPVIAVSGQEQSLIYEASLATRPIVELTGQPRGLIDWTSDEAQQLYQKARDWWTNDRVALEMAKKGPTALMGPESIKKSALRLGHFLSRIVIPRMDGTDDKKWQELIDWLDELRSLDVFATIALPYLLMQRPGEADAVAKKISADIDSDIEDSVSEAAKAIRHWLHLSAAARVPAPPTTLVSALIERVIFRSKTGAMTCLSQLSYLIFEMQSAITNTQVALIDGSLRPWHHATVLPVQDEATGDFYEAERASLRVCLAYLAGALKMWHAKSCPGTPEPPGVALWRDLCAADALPEIRRAFNAWEHVV